MVIELETVQIGSRLPHISGSFPELQTHDIHLTKGRRTAIPSVHTYFYSTLDRPQRYDASIREENIVIGGTGFTLGKAYSQGNIQEELHVIQGNEYGNPIEHIKLPSYSAIAYPFHVPERDKETGDNNQTAFIVNPRHTMPVVYMFSKVLPYPKPEDKKINKRNRYELLDFRSLKQQSNGQRGFLLLSQTPLGLYYFADVLRERSSSRQEIIIGDIVDGISEMKPTDANVFMEEFDIIFHELKESGLQRKVIQLSTITTAADFIEIMKTCHALHINGGYPRPLMKEFRRLQQELHINVPELLTNFAKTKGLTGTSAGANVLGNYCKDREGMFHGLGIINFSLVSHFGNRKKKGSFAFTNNYAQELADLHEHTILQPDCVSICLGQEFLRMER